MYIHKYIYILILYTYILCSFSHRNGSKTPFQSLAIHHSARVFTRRSPMCFQLSGPCHDDPTPDAAHVFVSPVAAVALDYQRALGGLPAKTVALEIAMDAVDAAVASDVDVAGNVAAVTYAAAVASAADAVDADFADVVDTVLVEGAVDVEGAVGVEVAVHVEGAVDVEVAVHVEHAVDVEGAVHVEGAEGAGSDAENVADAEAVASAVAGASVAHVASLHVATAAAALRTAAAGSGHASLPRGDRRGTPGCDRGPNAAAIGPGLNR